MITNDETETREPASEQWRWSVVLALFGVLLAGSTAGCREEESPEPTETAEQEQEASERDTGVDTGSEMEEKRAAYGLPFPPKVRGVTREDDLVEVTTRMELGELAEFYKSRLVDYEILQPGDRAIRVVGLRKYMPMIRGHRYGPLAILQYFPARRKPKGKPGSKEADAGGGSGTVHAPDEEASGGWRQPGSPVRLETADGELLAPGAKWGEPYTPPDGSPLDKPRYRANFGKPLGEWQLP